MRKMFVFLILGLFLISFASAYQSLGTFKQGSEINLQQVCNNCSYVNLSEVTYPNSSFALLGQYEMTKNGTIYNYTFSDTNTLGTYIYTTCGDLDGITACEVMEFDITYTGEKTLSTSSSILYSVFFVILFFLFITIIFAINKLPSQNARDDEGNIIKISMLKYFRSTLWFVEWMIIIAIVFIASNLSFAFLNEQLFANILFTTYRVMMALTPIIVILWFIWIFVKIAQDKEAKKLLSRINFGSRI